MWWPPLHGHSFATVSAPENVRVSPGASAAQKTGADTPKNENEPISVVLAGLNVSQEKSASSSPPETSVTVFVTEHDTLIAGHHCPPYCTTGSGAKIAG